MKRRLFLISFFLCVASLLCAETPAPDYHGGNGTILRQSSDGTRNITVRKYETAPFKAGGQLERVDPVLYDDYLTKNKIADFRWYWSKLTIHEVCEIEYIGQYNRNKTPIGELWFKITTDGNTGWICYYSNYFDDIYSGNSGEYLEVIQSGGKTWNVRRLEQSVCVYENLNVRDAPGLGGSKIGLIQMDEDHYFRSFNTVAITDETESIDGFDDPWVKIEFEKGKFGWVFGGYVGVERGGPKFMLPEDEIDFLFGDMP
ncbi:MAG: SH3 domain-containing protein [Treponema sp.]|nr:SH3 domain-containing protein [Candidatus Treponema caballi]